jgi:hypothetical protein
MALSARIVSPNAVFGRTAICLAATPALGQVASSPSPRTAGAAPAGAPSRARPVRERPRDQSIPKRYFNPSPLQEVGQASPGKPPDENKVKLGKSKEDVPNLTPVVAFIRAADLS